MINSIQSSSNAHPYAAPVAGSHDAAVANLTKALNTAHSQAKMIEKVTKIVLSVLAVGLLILGTITWNPLLILAGAGTYIFCDALSTLVLKQLANNIQEIKDKT